MAPLIDSVLGTMRLRRTKSELGFCAVCGDTVKKKDAVTRLRGGDFVHRDCATYRIREHRGRSRFGRGALTAR
jgi:hypothetical protein